MRDLIIVTIIICIHALYNYKSIYRAYWFIGSFTKTVGACNKDVLGHRRCSVSMREIWSSLCTLSNHFLNLNDGSRLHIVNRLWFVGKILKFFIGYFVIFRFCFVLLFPFFILKYKELKSVNQISKLLRGTGFGKSM